MRVIAPPLYEEHFGLAGRPFGEPSPLLPLPSHEAALRRVRYGLSDGLRTAVIYGRSGTGKTRLAAAVGPSMNARLIHLPYPELSAADLLAYVAAELGEPRGEAAASAPISAVVRRARRSLEQSRRRGERPILVVDEAHLIREPETFEAIRRLPEITAAGTPDLGLLFVGNAELFLRIPTSLSERLAVVCRLDPLDEAETSAYLAGRLAAVGGRLDLFTPEARAVLYRESEGLPRRLNRLGDLGLLLAFAEGLDRVTAEVVEAAAGELRLPSRAA